VATSHTPAPISPYLKNGLRAGSWVARFDGRLRSRDFRGWRDDRLRSVTGADGADINSPCWPCFVLRRAGGDDVGWGLSRIGLPDNIGSFVCVCRHLCGAHVIADTPPYD